MALMTRMQPSVGVRDMYGSHDMWAVLSGVCVTCMALMTCGQCSVGVRDMYGSHGMCAVLSGCA
jgi:hypothetical protein